MVTTARTRRPSLTLETIAATLAPFRIRLSEVQLGHIRDYVDVLLIWNQSVNLTAIEEPVEIVARHFGESLFAASFLEFRGSRLADVGTGAGFPGFPLKIAFPDVKMTFFESNRRKCAFLTEIIQRLHIDNVEISRQRYEEFKPLGERFDFVCARALGDYARLLRWARGVTGPGGRVVLWLGTEDSIRVGRSKLCLWDAPVAIPESRRRVILVGHIRFDV